MDAPGALHHVVGRGIEQGIVFRDALDREDFLSRVARSVSTHGLRVYAWALMPNHFHLLVETGREPLERVMRSVLSGYATRFNRRHARAGHLFQNRYKSVLCERDPYLLELVRYIHLNPVRAGIIPDLGALDRAPITGHSALLGFRCRDWQDVSILRLFSDDERQARRWYRRFVEEGVPQGRREDLRGGGLVRSAGGWTTVRRLRQGREVFRADERILGSSEFTTGIERQLDRLPRLQDAHVDVATLVDVVSAETDVDPAALTGGARGNRRTAAARTVLAYLWIDVLGRSGRELARMLGLNCSSIYRAAGKARSDPSRWRPAVSRLEKAAQSSNVP